MLERPISKAGWTRVAFGDVVRLSKGRVAEPEAAGIERVVGLEHIEPGDLRIRRWGDVADGTTFTTLFKPGQVLFGKRRAYQRKVAVADFEGVCSGDIYVLEPANDRLMPELLPFLCQTDAFFDHAVGTSAGSLSPRTNWTSLASFEFLLPPIQEQARLVELLVATEMSNETICEALLRSERMKTSLASFLFTGSNAPDIGKELSPDNLSVGWKIVSASDLCSAHITKGATPSSELTDKDTGIPFIKVYNLTFSGNLDFSIQPTFVSESGNADLRRSEVQPGDLLMNIVGPPLGKVSRVPPNFPRANINQAIVRYRPKDGLVGDWMQEYLLLPSTLSWFLKRSKKTSGQRNLTLEMCSSLPVPVPPADEMGFILKSLQQVKDRTTSLQRRVEAIREVKRQLLLYVAEYSDVH
jgi:type I restriction enzyme S subunit